MADDDALLLKGLVTVDRKLAGIETHLGAVRPSASPAAAIASSTPSTASAVVAATAARAASGGQGAGTVAAANVSGGLPTKVHETLQVCYRSAGIGVWGAVLRYGGMPLEKIAIISNSSQVSGSGQLAQAVKITFKDGALAPFKVVGSASLVAWFLQYSVMGFVFQSCDSALSSALGVDKMVYGEALFKPAKEKSKESEGAAYQAKSALKCLAAPLAAGMIESVVSNRAEVQRFYGIDKMTAIEAKLKWNPLSKQCGPAFMANTSRNFIMSSTSFVITPSLFSTMMPDDMKTSSNLLAFGMGVNIFGGNVIAITQQALWGRACDYAAAEGGRKIDYKKVVQTSLKAEGYSAFFTLEKWFARVLMNAPAQGTIPWFYNEVLPMGEPAVIGAAASIYQLGGSGSAK